MSDTSKSEKCMIWHPNVRKTSKNTSFSDFKCVFQTFFREHDFPISKPTPSPRTHSKTPRKWKSPFFKGSGFYYGEWMVVGWRFLRIYLYEISIINESTKGWRKKTQFLGQEQVFVNWTPFIDQNHSITLRLIATELSDASPLGKSLLDPVISCKVVWMQHITL